MTDATLIRALRTALAEAGDADRAPQMQRYMKSALPYHGISMPSLRRIVRPLLEAHRLAAREEWEAAVRELWDHATHREEWYAALELAGHRYYRGWQDSDTMPLYQHLVTIGAWWDVVDTIASDLVGGILASRRDAETVRMRQWAVSDDLWLRRVAILCQLRFGDDTDSELLADVIEANLETSRFGREFFIRKAIGWALRQYARTNPDWVRGFVAVHADRLSGLSRREALKHL